MTTINEYKAMSVEERETKALEIINSLSDRDNNTLDELKDAMDYDERDYQSFLAGINGVSAEDADADEFEEMIDEIISTNGE